MAQILKLAHFSQRDAVPKMQIRAGRIRAKLHAQSFARFQFFFKFFRADKINTPAF